LESGTGIFVHECHLKEDLFDAFQQGAIGAPSLALQAHPAIPLDPADF
jgi:hypothetical protein